MTEHSGAVGLLSNFHPEQRNSSLPCTEVLVSEQDAGDGWVGVISVCSKLLQLQQESNLSGECAAQGMAANQGARSLLPQNKMPLSG